MDIKNITRARDDIVHPRRVLIIVENLPVPFDRRVWSEATTLKNTGYWVSVICPVGLGYDKLEETIDGINVYRHSLPLEARGPSAYLLEYSAALFLEFVLSLKVAQRHGFDVIHACNPPDLIFLVGLFYKVFNGKDFSSTSTMPIQNFLSQNLGDAASFGDSCYSPRN